MNGLDDFVEKTYVAEVQATGATATVVSSQLKSGHDGVDFELVVVRRCLQRITSSVGDLAVHADVAIAQNSLDRIVRQLQLSRIESLSSGGIPDMRDGNLEPEAYHFQASPAFLLRRHAHATQMVSKQRTAAEHEAQRMKGERGLWGCLLKLAASATGNYVLEFDAEQVAERWNSLLVAARLFGLSRFATALRTSLHPAVVVRRIELSPAADRQADNKVLPRGIIACLTGEGILVTASSSSRWGTATDDAIVDRSLRPFMTANHEGSAVTIDFGGVLVVPSAYGFASIHTVLPGYFPRSWQLLGSMDCAEWTVLSDIRDSAAFHGKFPHAVFEIDRMRDTRAFTFLRVIQTGRNSFGTDEFQISSMEVYGSVLVCESRRAAPHLEKRPIERPRGFATCLSPPDVAAMAKKGKKGK